MSDYETNFAAGADEQAQALRDHLAGGNRPADWAHVIEEIEGLAASDRRELRNRLQTITVHLLKLRSARDATLCAGWRNTLTAEQVLDDWWPGA